MWLYNVHINPYSHRGYVDHDPKRKRQLLLHKSRDPETDRQDGGEGPDAGADADVFQERQDQGVDLALARGKEAHDKRETLRRREVDRETRAAVKERVRR